jgi:fused signal recognition particle receptor
MIFSFFRSKKPDAATLEQLEEAMLLADFGATITSEIITSLKKDDNLEDIIASKLQPFEKDLELKEGLNIVMLSGVNGSGKTTTIGKLANIYRGKKIAIAACDTFRAAANLQLKVWAGKTSALFIEGTDKADPASVAYRAVVEARDCDILFIDTAGRLHTNHNFMAELTKIYNSVVKAGGVNIISILVLDGTVGQNALMQAEAYAKAIKIDGVIINKLDSLAKGGILLNLTRTYKLPIYFVGVGEGMENIEKFSAERFAKRIV